MALQFFIIFSNTKFDHWFICSQAVSCAKIHGVILMGILQGLWTYLESAAKSPEKWCTGFSTKTIFLLILLRLCKKPYNLLHPPQPRSSPMPHFTVFKTPVNIQKEETDNITEIKKITRLVLQSSKQKTSKYAFINGGTAVHHKWTIWRIQHGKAAYNYCLGLYRSPKCFLIETTV